MDQLNRGKRMIPSKVYAADAGPVTREVTVIDRDQIFCDRKDATAAEGGNAAGAGFPLVRSVGGCDLRLLFVALVVDVVQRH